MNVQLQSTNPTIKEQRLPLAQMRIGGMTSNGEAAIRIKRLSHLALGVRDLTTISKLGRRVN